jgi:hypothetical protein
VRLIRIFFISVYTVCSWRYILILWLLLDGIFFKNFHYCTGGYIVTLTKFLTMYHSWIYSLHHSPSSSLIPFLEEFQQVSFFHFHTFLHNICLIANFVQTKVWAFGSSSLETFNFFSVLRHRQLFPALCSLLIWFPLPSPIFLLVWLDCDSSFRSNFIFVFLLLSQKIYNFFFYNSYCDFYIHFFKFLPSWLVANPESAENMPIFLLPYSLP